MKAQFWFVITLSFFFVTFAVVTIDDYNAIPNVNTWEAATHNSKSFLKALTVANNNSVDRTVLIPSGKEYYFANSTIEGFMNVNIQVDGIIHFSNKIKQFPTITDGRLTAFWQFNDCEGIHISGHGTLDGQGLNWWRLCYTGTDHRPNLLEFSTSRDISIVDIFLLSSPHFSINLKDCADIVIHDITIFIDSSIIRADNHSSVVYPLNTDGIDIAAYNVTIYNTNITNYDDAIVPKPCRSNGKYCQCAGAIYAYNNTITYSTGLTIGSVPPNENVNCIRNVTFKDTAMYRPLKAIYIKPNPGTSGTGIIEDITYENIFIREALWWTIWVGPQQQNQPGSASGTGCNFLFPFIPICPTQPLVSMNRITFRNITAVDTLPLFEGPGVFLCDAANPCTNFVFEDVINTMYTGNISTVIDQFPIPLPGTLFPTDQRDDDWEFAYLSTNLYGTIVGTVDPPICVNDVNCFWVEPSGDDDIFAAAADRRSIGNHSDKDKKLRSRKNNN